jgi:hypothetical protein
MTTDELFTLPVGTRVRWEEVNIDGEVVERSGDVLQIKWSDGDVLEVATNDVDIGELARSLEVIASFASDEPLILDH